MQLQPLATLTTLLLSAVLAVLAAQLSWQFYGLFIPYEPPPARKLQPASSPIEQRYNMARLQALPLFGQEQATPARVSKPRKIPVRRQPSNLKLIGLIGGPKGVAIIRSGKLQRTAMAGDALKFPGSKQTLLEIHSNYVTVLHNGRAERLVLQGK